MLGIILSLFPLFGYGVSDYSASRLSKDTHPAVINFLYTLIFSVPAITIGLAIGLPTLTVINIVHFALAAIITNAGFICLVIAFRHGAAGVAAPIANAYAVITLLLAITFLGQRVTVTQAVATVVIVIGIAALSRENNYQKKYKLSKNVTFAIFSMLFFGIGFTLFDIAGIHEWYENVTLFQIANMITTFVILVVWVRKDLIEKLTTTIKSKFMIIGSIIGGVGTAGLFAAIQSTENIGIPAAIAAASPLVTALLARVFNHELLHMLQRIGAFIVVTGVALLALST